VWVAPGKLFLEATGCARNPALPLSAAAAALGTLAPHISQSGLSSGFSIGGRGAFRSNPSGHPLRSGPLTTRWVRHWLVGASSPRGGPNRHQQAIQLVLQRCSAKQAVGLRADQLVRSESCCQFGCARSSIPAAQAAPAALGVGHGERLLADRVDGARHQQPACGPSVIRNPRSDGGATCCGPGQKRPQRGLACIRCTEELCGWQGSGAGEAIEPNLRCNGVAGPPSSAPAAKGGASRPGARLAAVGGGVPPCAPIRRAAMPRVSHHQRPDPVRSCSGCAGIRAVSLSGPRANGAHWSSFSNQLTRAFLAGKWRCRCVEQVAVQPHPCGAGGNSSVGSALAGRHGLRPGRGIRVA